MRILVIEDELSIRRGLIALLKGAGHDVEAVEDGKNGLKMGRERAFDLVILDLLLPEIPGLEVCVQLRKIRPGLPILMLTALASDSDVVQGLDTGADDYLTKPFSPEELLARIEALGRRIRRLGTEPDIIRVGECEMDLILCQVKRGETTTPLTAREAGILRWLYRHRERVATREELLEEVWGLKPNLDTRTIDSTIARLRRKIETDPEQPKIIVSRPGMGYEWGIKEAHRNGMPNAGTR